MFYILLSLCLLLQPLLQGASLLIPGSLTHETVVSPKQKVEGSIPIQNEGDSPLKIQVTLADYLFNSKGESFFPSAGTCPRSNTSWIQTNKMQFEVAPHATYSFAYTLQVPDDPSLEGSYWSIFLIEPVEENSVSPEQKQSLGVQTVIRYGVQVLTHLGKTGSYDLKITDKKIVQEKELKTFAISVDNIGTHSLSPALTLELIQTTGKKMGRFETVKQRILPSCSTTYQVDLSSVPQGKYKAMLILDHGENALFGAQYDFSLD
ncbi:MAG: hypothetical protein K2Y01_09520 [Rhabdochlamydiaceae bacterium]|nr:hypothetical protein [Rhabdochlamydiaceae bacterium]